MFTKIDLIDLEMHLHKFTNKKQMILYHTISREKVNRNSTIEFKMVIFGSIFMINSNN